MPRIKYHCVTQAYHYINFGFVLEFQLPKCCEAFKLLPTNKFIFIMHKSFARWFNFIMHITHKLTIIVMLWIVMKLMGFWQFSLQNFHTS
jgi:hypothetical protein